MVSRSLAARIESMMVVNDASTSGGTVPHQYQLTAIAIPSDGGGREGPGATYKTLLKMIGLGDGVVRSGFG